MEGMATLSWSIWRQPVHPPTLYPDSAITRWRSMWWATTGVQTLRSARARLVYVPTNNPIEPHQDLHLILYTFAMMPPSHPGLPSVDTNQSLSAAGACWIWLTANSCSTSQTDRQTRKTKKSQGVNSPFLSLKHFPNEKHFCVLVCANPFMALTSCVEGERSPCDHTCSQLSPTEQCKEPVECEPTCLCADGSYLQDGKSACHFVEYENTSCHHCVKRYQDTAIFTCLYDKISQILFNLEHDFQGHAFDWTWAP